MSNAEEQYWLWYYAVIEAWQNSEDMTFADIQRLLFSWRMETGFVEGW